MAEEPVVSKPKKSILKRWWFWAIVVVLVGAAASSGGGRSNSSTAESTGSQQAASGSSASAPAPESSAPEAPATQTTAKIGTPLPVGDLVFTVTDAKLTRKLKSPLGDKSGNWMVVTIRVKNNSKEAVTIDSSFFKLLEADGTTYETDSDNLMYLNSDSNFFLEKINPKLSKTGQVLFAIPASAKNLQLQVQTGVFGTETGVISLTK